MRTTVPDKQQFGEHYSRLADDELARIALSGHLVPDAQRALDEELQKRRLTDLSHYKRDLEEAAADSSLGHQLEFQATVNRCIAEWTVVLMAWVCATFVPFALAGSPHTTDTLKIGLVGLAFVAFSGYLGIKARRQGSRRGYLFKFTLPLILLSISTVIAVGSALK